MGKPLQGTIVTEDAKRLVDLEQQFRDGFREQVLALEEIHRRKLYVAMGFERFEDYCKERLDLQRAHAYRLLDCAPVLVSPNGRHVTNERQVRPLAGMKPENKVKVIGLAASVAEKHNAKLTGALVESVAKKNFRWKTRAEWREEQRDEIDRKKLDHKKFMDRVERRVVALLDLGKPDELVEEYGSALGWPHVDVLRDWLNDLLEIS